MAQLSDEALTDHLQRAAFSYLIDYADADTGLVADSYTDILTMRSRKALPITETELRLIAAAAIMGDRSNPNTG